MKTKEMVMNIFLNYFHISADYFQVRVQWTSLFDLGNNAALSTHFNISHVQQAQILEASFTTHLRELSTISWRNATRVSWARLEFVLNKTLFRTNKSFLYFDNNDTLFHNK